MKQTILSEKNNKVQANRKAKEVSSIRMITMVALLSAISYIMAFMEFPVPLTPSFARMDFSDFPALIGSFAFGPVAGLLIEFVKNALQLTSTSTGGIGELANFLMGGSFVFTAGLIHRFRKTQKMAWISGILGSIVMGIVAALSNYYILLPLFENFMPIDQLIASFETYISFIHSKLDIVIYNAFPFNVMKGVVITIVAMLIYKRIGPWLNGVEQR